MPSDADRLFRTDPADVHAVIASRMLADGYDFVFDAERSHGARLADAKTGREYVDLFSFFASMPVSFDHPGLKDPLFLARLQACAVHRPTNSDVYTTAMADFVATFSRTLPPAYKHLFFIDGGTLAVENALKTAFDWKVQKNLRRGLPETCGLQIAHFRQAFHGRSGYCLSLTNTFDPRKTKWFPKFDWPRLPAPKLRFPVDERVLEETRRVEDLAISELERHLVARPFEIAAVVVETIQGEGGDNHFRPEFFRRLRDLCDAEEMLLVFDEVQCGFGLTGTWWAFEQFGVEPDVFAFGKKTQTCGIAANGRVDDVDSVFKAPSRINSTWGGNLVDMVRCTRYVEIIEQDRLLENVREVGAYALERLGALTGEFPDRVSNVRGRGLMCAFDLPSAAERDRLKNVLEEDGVIVLGCGERSIRFRPVLDLTRADADLAVDRLASGLRRLG
ncbi:MAG TPA: L-lysine 6-transaminase [Planctomycetota bacterium]|nr:L-lysine 6-transaminase [Planctomycetota bacterium]